MSIKTFNVWQYVFNAFNSGGSLLKKWFDPIQLCLLLVVSPFFFFPKPYLWWIFFIIPILWIMRKLSGKEFVEPSPIDLQLFIFLVAIFVTTLRVTNFSHSLPKIAGVLFAIAFFYAMIALVKTGKIFKWSVFLFLCGGFVFALMGLLGMPTFKTKHLHFLAKIKEKIPNIDFNLGGIDLGFSPTVVGGLLLLFIPLFFVMTILTSGWKRFVSCIGLLFTCGVLVLTQARGAWAGLFFSTLIMVFLLLRRTLEKKNIYLKKVYLFIIASLIIAFIIILIVFYAGSKTDELKPGIKQAEGTLLFRFQMWDLAVPLIRSHPMWGIGLNNFRVQVPEVRFFLSHAHNQFIHIAAELGIPALIAFVAILLAMGYMCMYVWKHSENKLTKMITLGLGWGQLAHLFFCLTDAIPPGAKLGIIFWVSLALITSIYNSILAKAFGSPETFSRKGFWSSKTIYNDRNY